MHDYDGTQIAGGLTIFFVVIVVAMLGWWCIALSWMAEEKAVADDRPCHMHGYAYAAAASNEECAQNRTYVCVCGRGRQQQQQMGSSSCACCKCDGDEEEGGRRVLDKYLLRGMRMHV